MRWIQKRIELFCRNHPHFGIPNLMLYIAVANVAIYLLDTFSTYTCSALLAFNRAAIFRGQIWRLLTFVLLPQEGDKFLVTGSGILVITGSGFFFVVFAGYFYYWIASLLEREWGTARFTAFYLTGILLNLAFGFITGYASMRYVNLSLFFVFAVFYPHLWVRVLFVLPMKVKWLAWIDAALFAVEIVKLFQAGGLAYALLPVVALLPTVLFCWEEFTEELGRRRQRWEHRHSQQTVNFRKATRSEYEKRGYIHKCAVCGLTDAEAPDMEFRYCSKCAGGTYCYCSAHIHNHEHIV